MSEDTFDDLMVSNHMYIKRRIAFLEEMSKPEPDKDRIKFLSISSSFWKREHDEILNGECEKDVEELKK